MLERKRTRRYTAVPGEEGEEELLHDGEAAEDLELGEGVGFAALIQEEGVVTGVAKAAAGTAATTATTKPDTERAGTTNLDDEVDNWDENAVDNWDDEDDIADIGVSRPLETTTNGDHGKKRAD